MSARKIKICFAIITTLTFFISLLPYKSIMAIELSQNVGYLGQIQVTPYIQQTPYSCNFNNSVTVPYFYNDGTSTCSNGVTYYMPAMTFNRDYIFEINLYAYKIKEESISSYINTPPTLTMVNKSLQTILNGEYLGVDIKNVSNGSSIISYYFRFPVNGNYNITNELFSLSTQVGIKPNEYVMTSRIMPLWAKENLSVAVDNTGVITAINNMSQNLGQKLEYIDGWLAQIAQNTQNIQGVNDTIQDNIDQTQQASDEGNTNANQGQTDTEQASANVFGVIGNVINAFNTSPRGNCVLNMNLGNMDMGQVDFCSGKPSQWQIMLGGAMSIVLVYVIYRIAKNVFNIFISAMAFAQGGEKNDG